MVNGPVPLKPKGTRFPNIGGKCGLEPKGNLPRESLPRTVENIFLGGSNGKFGKKEGKKGREPVG